MRTKYLLKGLLLHFVFYFFAATAQQIPLCGSYVIDTASLNKALQFEKRNGLNKVQAGKVLIRVYFHITSDDQLNNMAATPADIDNEFNSLVAAYAADNICFLNAGYDYVNNTFLNSGFNPNTVPNSVYDPYRIAFCINVFYVKYIIGKNGNCNCGIGGIAFNIPGTICLIASSNIGVGQSIAHEVGHCLGLLHTFSPGPGSTFEDIDGSNAAFAGDYIQDTPADPYVYNSLKCYSTTPDLCTYTGYCTDPKGKSNFTPPYSNLMAYWWGE